MSQNGLTVSKDMDETMEEHEYKGHTAVLVAINGEYCRLRLASKSSYVERSKSCTNCYANGLTKY
jgi:hypothetical protein